MDAQRQLFDVAWEILQTGRDRVPRIADRRALSKMRRQGLIQYEDGYSVEPSVMERAALFWSGIARDPHITPERAQEFQEFSENALRWAAKHQVTPDLKQRYFGELPFPLYHILWNSITKGRPVVEGVASKDAIRRLLKEGYLETTDVRAIHEPTAKAKALVREQGNPFLQAKTAERVVARFVASAEKVHWNKPVEVGHAVTSYPSRCGRFRIEVRVSGGRIPSKIVKLLYTLGGKTEEERTGSIAEAKEIAQDLVSEEGDKLGKIAP